MSSPVGHSLTGMILYLSYNKWGSLWSNRNEILLYIFFAVAPDLDLIPGLLGGDIYRYHHGPPHSIFFALLFTLPFSLPRLKRGLKRFLSSWGIFFSLYCTHLLIDFFTIDRRPPYGSPLFWPIWDRYLSSPITFLPPVYKESWTALVSLNNLYTMLIEVAIFLPLLLLIYWYRKSKGERIQATGRHYDK